MKRLTLFFTLLLAFTTILTACGDDQDDVNEVVGEESQENNDVEDVEEVNEESIDPIKVFTTLFPLEDFANKIGGEYVESNNIVPLGADAHTFEPTSNQIIEIASGDLFIYNGADFEGFAESIKDTLATHDVEILATSEGIDLINYTHGHSLEDDHGHSHDEDDHGHSHDEDDHGHSHDEDDYGHSHGDKDPHVWLDPIRAIQIAENIKNTFVELRPDAQDVFSANFEELKIELESLDEEFSQMTEDISKNTIIVSHAGYGYWEERYGIQQVGISGLSPTNEPSFKQMESVMNYMRDHEINHVMFEQNIPLNTAQTVKEEVGAEELWIHNLETISEDEKAAGVDYFSLMRKNIETLQIALQ